MAKADIKAGSAFVELMLRDSAFVKGLKNAQKKLSAFGGELQGIGKSMMAAGAVMLLPFAASVKTFASFDDAMRAVKGTSNATTAEFEMLSKKAKELGAATSFTAVEVASLMTELGRAGFKPDEIEKMTGAVLDLARATGTDATLASGIMAASIRQFEMGAGDATRIADSLTAAANMSFNSVESLGEALSYAGPVAADFGMDIESTLGVLGALGNVGIQGSNAGTAIRRLLTISGAEAQKMKKIFGVSFLDAAGNVRPLVDTLGEVSDATKNLGSGEKAAKFNEAFGLLGITGASAIGRASVSAKQLEKDIRAAGGQAAKTAAEMDAGIGGAFRIMFSAAEGLAIEVGSTLSEAVTVGANAIRDLATAGIEWVKNNKEMVKIAVAVAAGVVAIGSAFFAAGVAASGIAVAMGGVLALMTMAKGIFAYFAGSILFAFSPMGILIRALRYGAEYWLKFSESGKAAVAVVASSFQFIKAVVTDNIGAIYDAIKSGDYAGALAIALGAMKVILQTGIANLASAVGGEWGDFIGTLGTQLVNGEFSAAWGTILNGMLARFKPFVDLVLASWDIIKLVWETTVNALMTAWDTLVDLVSGAWEWFTKSFFSDNESMGESWGDFVEGLVGLFIGAADAIADKWQKTTSAISDFILEDAAKGGILGTAALLGTGVDIKTEQGKAELIKKQNARTLPKLIEQLKSELAAADANGGSIADDTTSGVSVTSEQIKARIAELEARLRVVKNDTPNFLKDTQTSAREDLAAQREEFKNRSKEIADKARIRNKEARPDLESVGGADTAAAAAAKAKADLEAARKAAGDAASKVDEEKKKAAEEASKTKAPGGGASAGIASEVFGSFSAAALQASGGTGGTAADRTAKNTEEMYRAQREAIEEARKQHKELVAKMDNGGFMGA